VTNLIAKLTNSIANETNSIAKATDSTTNRTNSIAKKHIISDIKK